jgi:hypothetical protein
MQCHVPTVYDKKLELIQHAGSGVIALCFFLQDDRLAAIFEARDRAESWYKCKSRYMFTQG